MPLTYAEIGKKCVVKKIGETVRVKKLGGEGAVRRRISGISRVKNAAA
ncbi:MAG: hypothetical protein J1F04_02900 [Oscillospiraceae bacterium]|nr:hypothetical protein [Oscillospiraceae bacterium]